MKTLRLWRRFGVAAIAFVIIVTASGCFSLPGQQQPAATDAGVYKSIDGGERFTEVNAIVSVGEKQNLRGVDVYRLIMDPQDAKTIYLLSQNHGLFYSYDGAISWNHDRTLTGGRITSLAIDPKNKCQLFAAQANKIYKSVDCNRTWSVSYFESRSSVTFSALAIDAYNPGVVYAGESNGDLLKSTDGGSTWTSIYSAKNQIQDIMVNPRDTRIIYVPTTNSGIHKTLDGGNTWRVIRDEFSGFSGGRDYRDLIFSPSESDGLIYLSKFGILKTSDGGNTWSPITVNSAPGQANFISVAVSPSNSNVIYVATANSIQKTVDQGANWSSKELPSSRKGTVLLIDPTDASIVYLGTGK